MFIAALVILTQSTLLCSYPALYVSILIHDVGLDMHAYSYIAISWYPTSWEQDCFLFLFFHASNVSLTMHAWTQSSTRVEILLI